MPNTRIALVTGGNQGVGRQVAKELAANGLTVLVGSRNFERGAAAAEEIRSGAIPIQLDVTDQRSIAAAAEPIRQEFGRLGLLVNNAAISNTRKGSLSLREYREITRASNPSLDEVRAVWDTNVFGVLAVYQAMLPILRESSDATHRQCLERSRLADGERGPGVPLPRVVRSGVVPTRKSIGTSEAPPRRTPCQALQPQLQRPESSGYHRWTTAE
jgi:NAD(P)-dependent dehydrogenase (short-subunit alcohol dehydrogenase family)